MVQVLPNLQQPSNKESILSGLGGAAQNLAQQIPQMLGARQAEKEQKKEREKFADKLKTLFPDSATHQALAELYKSNLSPDIISTFTNQIMGVDPFKQNQQERLNRDTIRKNYNQSIKDLNDSLKEAFDSGERAEIKRKIATLRRERDQQLGMIGMEDEDEVDEYLEEEPIKVKPEKKAKPKKKLDEATAHKLLAQAGNDPEKAKKLAKDMGYE